MTKKTDEVGLTVHILRSGTMYNLAGAGEFGVRSEIGHRGQTLHLSPEDVAVSRDRAGNSYWSLSPAEQVARWGEQRFAIGPFPADELSVIPGTTEWEDAYDAARRAAWQHPEGIERTRALAELREKFGPPPVTSKTLGRMVGDEERAAILQDEGRAE